MVSSSPPPETPGIPRAVLEDRWSGMVTAPWRPGDRSKLWRRLTDVLVDLVHGVSRCDFDTEAGALAPDVYTVTDQLEEVLRQHTIRLVDELGVARSGWQQITGEPPAAVE